MDIQIELLIDICIHHLKVNSHPALPQDEMISSTHRTIWTFIQLSACPSRQLAWVSEKLPYLLHWDVDDFGWTYFHHQPRFPSQPVGNQYENPRDNPLPWAMEMNGQVTALQRDFQSSRGDSTLRIILDLLFCTIRREAA
jgi:hypothetical protein